MWEGLSWSPRGRLSTRQFILVLATILVACFAFISAAPTAFALNKATWKDGSVVYEGNTYTGPHKATDADGLNLSPGTPYYVYEPPTTDASQSAKKAFIIYFSSGSDPPTETSATYASYTLNGGVYSNQSDQQPITVTPAKPVPAASISAGGKTSCGVDGIGWIVCPVSNFLAKAMDYLYGVISQFMEVQPLQTTQNNALYRSWNLARNLANICFVIAFLIVIYAQVSGGMMSNYTIKKILPRVIVAAILVNVSYWICAIGIDLSNILGYSVQDLFTGVRQTLVGGEKANVSWTNMTELIVTGGTASLAAGLTGAAALAATGGSIASAIFLILPALVGVILSALIAIIILAMRQALITVLVILAPLAFVAYLLPNTEKWFERWRDLFGTMLFLFPIFSVIFGGSQVAGAAIIQNASSIPIVILGMVVQVAPLIITPMIVRFSGSLLGRIAGMLNNPNKGLIDRTRNWSQPRAELYKNRNLARTNTGMHRFGTGRVARRMYRREQVRQKRDEGYKRGAENNAHSYTSRNPRKDYGYWDEQYRRADHQHQNIEAHHQAAWDQRFQKDNARFDASLFNQEAQTRKYAQSSEVAKANLDATIREMQAGQNTVSAAAIATSVSDPKQRAKIANDLGQLTAKLQDLNRELVVEGERKSSADSVIQGQIAEMYDKNLKIRETDVQTAIEKAGGIDDNGTLKVRAKAKSNIIKLYMENVDAVGTIYSSEGYTPQEQLDVIEKNVLRGGEEPASEMHVYAALKRTLLTNGNNWSAQKILDFAATRGMKYDEETKKFQAYDTNGNLYDLSEEEVRSRRDFQQMVKEYIDKSPLKVDYMSATQRSLLETGTFIAPPGKMASEQSILFDTKIGKYDEARIVSADVDVLQRMVQVFRDPDNRTADNREAREKLLARILAAQTNPQVNASIKDRERGVMNALASYLDDSDTRSGAEKEGVMYYVRDESGNKTNAYIDSTGALRRVTADTPGAESESISVKAPDVYDITKMQAP